MCVCVCVCLSVCVRKRERERASERSGLGYIELSKLVCMSVFEARRLSECVKVPLVPVFK